MLPPLLFNILSGVSRWVTKWVELASLKTEHNKSFVFLFLGQSFYRLNHCLTHAFFIIERPTVESSLRKKFDTLEQSRSLFLSALNANSEKQLCFKPTAQSWSMLEVLHHLVLVEQKSLRFVETRGREMLASPPLGWQASVKSFMLTFFLRTPLKFKAPSERVLPSLGFSLGELSEQWLQTRHGFEQLLEKITIQSMHRPIYIHPFAGVFNISQMLLFVQEHFNHHLKQINRIRKCKDFPKGKEYAQPR